MHKQYVDQVHAFLRLVDADGQRKLVVRAFAGMDLFVGRDVSANDFVEHRALLLDEAGTTFVDLSLWCATGFVLVVNWCNVRETIVWWQECAVLQPLLAMFAQLFHEWTGGSWSGGPSKSSEQRGKFSMCKSVTEVRPVCSAALAAIRAK